MQRESEMQNTREATVRAGELRQLALEHIWFQNVPWEDVLEPGGLKIMVEGEGCYLTDIEGRTYLDAASGLWLAEVGYGRKEIAEAISRQAGKLHYTTSTNPAEPTIRLAATLAGLTPGSLSKCFFVSGGAEANETALKMALQYHWLAGNGKRYKFVARKLSYHGATLGTMGLGCRMLNRTIFEPLLPGARNIPGPYCYHCDFGLEYPGCDLRCAYELEKAIQFEGPDTVAAFIGEPISQSSGVSIPPPEYWPTVRAICDKYQVILICDEVISAFGRTGKMFGIEHFDFIPDILTVAKGLTSGYVPMGAAIAKTEVAEKFRPGTKEYFQHVITFGGHAVASAAALANIEIIQREGLVENAAAMGSYLLDALRTLASHPSVGDVRGLGLLCAIELVKDKKTRAGFDDAERHRLRRFLTRKAADAGVLLMAGDRISICPPLIVKKPELDKIVEVVDRCLMALEKEESYWN